MYWDFNGERGRRFTPERAEREGELKYYFNMDDVEEISGRETMYYDNKDLFALTRQHACHSSCIQHYKRKNAEKSSAKILEELRRRIKDSEYTIVREKDINPEDF